MVLGLRSRHLPAQKSATRPGELGAFSRGWFLFGGEGNRHNSNIFLYLQFFKKNLRRLGMLLATYP
jgi:hypothetical protein